MSTAKYYCARCSLPLREWGKGDGWYWKHSGGCGSRKACADPVPVKLLGWRWQTVHRRTSEVVNSGFSEGPERPRLGRTMRGFFFKLTPVFSP
jgi:hypothetical protein